MPGFIGMPEIILLGLLALLLFGPKKLPEMGRGLGKGLREFKQSVGGEHHSEDETRKLMLASEPTTVETVTPIENLTPIETVTPVEAHRVA